MSNSVLLSLGYAFLGGVVPALVWLYFLLKEDSRCPEPRTLIALTFFAGMLTVPVALWLESMACAHFGCISTNPNPPTVLAWAFIEEGLKFGFAAAAVLWRRAVNESIDFVVYMVTIALGFAALENTLFFASTLSMHGLWGATGALETNNLRFIGSTLLHVLSSSAIGFALAFSYLKKPSIKLIYGAVGLILAVALHALFNFLILPGGPNGVSHTLDAFFTVWTGVLVFFALFEVLKYFRYGKLRKNTC